MEMLKLRCHFKLLIFTFFIIACLIAYKFVVVQRYISSYNDGESHYAAFLKQKSAAYYYGNNLVDTILNDPIYKENNVNAFNGERIIHLDLKGAPPSLNYFHHLFPLLHSLNVSGLLIEYEDVFPYSNKFTHAANTYSKEDIRHLLKLAKKYKLEVIPLVQTFGHLEFVLKVYKFFRLREVFRYPQSICPSQNSTFEVITGMIDEVIALHSGIRYIHIGCDEVYQLGACPLCNARMNENRWDVKDLFLDHVTKIARYIRSTYPNIKPLMWDDELRRIPVDNLKKFKIGHLIEPVVWYYDNPIPFKFSFWEKYSKVFPAVWIASSFKGASGPDQILPNIINHMENQKTWLRIVAEFSYLINFKGIMLTGWQRYDHFAVLCELLPVSIPSLVNSLLILKGSSLGYTEIPKKVKDVITCGFRDQYFDRCKFPGVDLYAEVVAFSRLRKEMDEVLNSNYIRGWLTEHNLQHGYFNPLLVEELSYKIRECQVNLNRSKEKLENELNNIYDSYTVTEWTETFVHPYFHKLGRLSGVLRYIINITEWSPRPIEMINGRKDN